MFILLFAVTIVKLVFALKVFPLTVKIIIK